MNKFKNIVMDDRLVRPLAKTLTPLVGNLQWNIIMDDWHLDEKSLRKWHNEINHNFPFFEGGGALHFYF